MDNLRESQSTTPQSSRRGNALVFISHDSRDAEIAEAFSGLISSVSAGVLKSFRSSDKRGNQGIDYGSEWYPEIMRKLEAASDVVCLLTHQSIDRPWILFEAGVAKGKLNTPVHGVALGIPLALATPGPFAQFQNVKDEVDSLTGLVIQLISRIPEAEPDRDVVKTQVEAFKRKVQPLLDKQRLSQDQLAARIEQRMDPGVIEEVLRITGNEFGDNLGLLIVGSWLKDDIPWMYEFAAEVYRKLETGHPEASRSLNYFLTLFDAMIHRALTKIIDYQSEMGFHEVEDKKVYFRGLFERIVSRAEKTNPIPVADTEARRA
jgi:hypothetical protein